VIGFAGSMKPWHGVDVLVEAFASVRRHRPDAHLLLVGSGPEERALRDRARESDLAGSVTFTGYVDHQHVPGLVKRFDVAVAPYRPQPAFYFSPLKVTEYLAAGVPVVYADEGDLADLVGAAGIPHQPGSAVDLAVRILDILGDDGLRARLTANTAARAQGRDWDTVADTVLAFASGADCPPV
jgi:glycosyltransferase involved in cell wall biosynthesis